jgi:aconitate hydratase
MINALGVVGWGVGGIEAEAGMLGQPVYFLTPDVVGVHLHGRLREGVTATDLVLTITEMLRSAKVVGKFVEFFGEGAAALAVPDRATIANMAPEYGATLGFFPIDERTVDYFRITGRSEQDIDAVVAYYKAQELFGIPRQGQCDYTQVLELDLATITPSVAGPKRPQDRIELPSLKRKFNELFSKPATENGFGKPADELSKRYPTKRSAASTDGVSPPAGGGDQSQRNLPPGSARHVVEMVDNRPTPNVASAPPGSAPALDLGHGDVLIAAITSCTNTSNPAVLLAAGLLAKRAVERGLSVKPHVKTSLAPGSRVVTEYLRSAGLLPYLEKLGFGLVAYGCTTCIGNSGPLDSQLEDTITRNDVVAAAVLSGNRNFEARIHASIKANFLMSPPLVVAFAIAGTANIDMTKEPLGRGKDGKPVYLKDIWPSQEEVAAVMRYATDPSTYRDLYADFTKGNPLWNGIPAASGRVYAWEKSTYIAEPPFFVGFGMQPGKTSNVLGARALGIFGDSVTTDHISPAGSIKPDSPAGRYLQAHGVGVIDFNSYGSRRGNHEVMMRGTFANVRIKNLMVPARSDGTRVEGGVTLFQPSGEPMSIYDAAMKYLAEGRPTVVFAGEEYGTGSSRDWAAKGTQLLGVKAVVARSFERIHRSNLVNMGVLPLQFLEGESAGTLKLTGRETFDVLGIGDRLTPRGRVMVRVTAEDGTPRDIAATARIDTPEELVAFRHGGILPYVLRQLLRQ